ncbi:MAG: hypothetical protein E7157_01685 [Lactobacillales bacterium]|nr:hypothetical protein [Lactobacillales bacterium]
MKKFFKLIVILILCFPFSVLSLETIKANYDSLLSKIETLDDNLFLNNHPIGSIYITTSSDENTAAKIATKYGGTWEAYGTNRVLRGTTGTVSSTGGANTVTLTTSHLPSHTHSISHTHATPATTISSSGAHTHSAAAKNLSLSSLKLASAGAHTHSYSEGGTIIIVGANTTFLSYAYGFQGTTDSYSFWLGANKSNASISSAGAHTHSVTGSVTIPALSISSSGAHTHTVPAMTTGAASTSNSGSTGSGGSFSVLDPYITVYMYKRVS